MAGLSEAVPAKTICMLWVRCRVSATARKRSSRQDLRCVGLVWVMKTAMGWDSSIPCSRRRWCAVVTSSAEGKTCGSMSAGLDWS